MLLETDVLRSDFIVIFFYLPKTGQPLILKSILDPFTVGIEETYSLNFIDFVLNFPTQIAGEIIS